MKDRAHPHDRLRRLLREGDPATDAAEPTPLEVQHLRSTVLATAEANARRRALLIGGRPLLASAAAAGLTLALGLAFWRAIEDPSAGPAVEPTAASPAADTGAGGAERPAPVASDVPSPAGAASPEPSAMESAPRFEASRGETTAATNRAAASALALAAGSLAEPRPLPLHRKPAPARTATPATQAAREASLLDPGAPARLGVPEADPLPARQIQFSTPGGTRIVWVLDPHFTL